jgi:acetyltransferase
VALQVKLRGCFMDFELSPLLNPKSVAIIGVSRNPSRIGGRLFKYLTRHGYEGSLALVNPKYKELNGVTCYQTVSDVSISLDCALIAVPEKQVLSVLNECADNNVKAAVVFSSGFAEMGNAGKELFLVPVLQKWATPERKRKTRSKNWPEPKI